MENDLTNYQKRDEDLSQLLILRIDTQYKGFADECKRQSTLLNNDHQEDEILCFLDASADRTGWKA
ncbi:MAG: DUF3018 family protein [Chlorobium sp.]|nr:DUF3018 family protein [Chlorobium sp.]